MLPPLSPARARALIDALPQTRLLVVGDVMLDQFIVGRVSRISPEAPVPVVEYARDEFRAGGAANVALNVHALGGGVELVGLVGVDQSADRLRELLAAAGLGSTGLITDDARRTTTKTRIVTTRNQQVARVDYESDTSPGTPVEDALIAQIDSRMDAVDAVIVSDYLKGVVTRRLMAAIVAAAQALEVPVFVDPKIPHLEFYAGSTMVTPNHYEAEAATHLRIRNDDEARLAAIRVRERARCEGVLITRGEHGMWLLAAGEEGALPAAAREVSDVTGAGDTVIATLASIVAGGGTAAESARLANEAAGIVVGKFGPSTVSPAELLARLG
jgi:D-beta-D-heptose 7-phosphate kinase/D-beta-D-heptose 1-phosphate adenosyltransferase